MSAVCPACGVAVVAGYVKCPKCGANLPFGRRATTVVSGGTALDDRGGFPVVPVAVGAGIVFVLLVLVVALRGDDAPPTPAAVETSETAEPDEGPGVSAPEVPDPVAAPRPPARPDPAVAASDLDSALKRERLWGTVQVLGARVDVRSGACSDPGMAPVIEAALPALREAGVTSLRCLEKSGAVAFERDL